MVSNSGQDVIRSSTDSLQGVPALFRWLSKKYPKIVNRVVEDTPSKVRGDDGEIAEVPIRYESKNPNGFEVDNLYRELDVPVLCLAHIADMRVVDMNGIVHPCTHPEGKPAPETEEDMMVEIFAYTERVVNMARPRKVLMMAIGGLLSFKRRALTDLATV
jgi:5'-3' exoribonuclease 2